MFRLALALLVSMLSAACGSKTGLRELPEADRDAGVADATIDRTIDAPDDRACVPQSEQCNGLDDDCDGVADDGITCFFLNGQELEPVPAAGCGPSWYSYGFPDPESANPAPDIRRSGQVVMAIQHAVGCGGFLAVIADLPNDGSGGQLEGTFVGESPGAALLAVSDEPSECGQFGDTVQCSWTWQPCCTDGVLVGPLLDDTCINVRLDSAVGVAGLIVRDGPSDEIPVALPVTLQICSSMKPAVN